MHNRFTRTWGLVIAMLVIAMALAALIAWNYQCALLHTTPAIAILTLGFSLFGVTMVSGAIVSFLSFKLGYAYGRERALKEPPNPGEEVAPYEAKLFGLRLVRHPAESFLFRVTGEPMEKKTSGRKPLYDDETIRTAIQKWEQKENISPEITLVEFLEQEFGNHVDGSLHVPPQIFYSWRRQMMKNSDD